MRYFLAVCALALLIFGCENKAEVPILPRSSFHELVKFERVSFQAMGEGSGNHTIRIHYKDNKGNVSHLDFKDYYIKYKIVPDQPRKVEFVHYDGRTAFVNDGILYVKSANEIL